MVVIAYLTASLCLPSFYFPHSLPQDTAYEISCKVNSMSESASKGNHSVVLCDISYQLSVCKK